MRLILLALATSLHVVWSQRIQYKDNEKPGAPISDEAAKVYNADENVPPSVERQPELERPKVYNADENVPPSVERQPELEKPKVYNADENVPPSVERQPELEKPKVYNVDENVAAGAERKPEPEAPSAKTVKAYNVDENVVAGAERKPEPEELKADKAKSKCKGRVKKYIQAGPAAFPHSRTMTVSSLPDSKEEQKRLHQQMRWSDYQPTGFYLNPGVSLTVHVSGARRGAHLYMYVGTPGLINPENEFCDVKTSLKKSKKLQNGQNTVFKTNVAGILYVKYTNWFMYDDDDAPPVTLTLGDMAQPFPLFRQGITTDEEWISMLEKTKVPFAEMDGKRVTITGLASHALKYARRGETQQALLDMYQDILSAQERIMGLSATAPKERDWPSRLRPMVVQANRMSYAYATDYRAAIGSNSTHTVDIWLPSFLRESWKMWHEFGHQLQHVATWSWDKMGEVTNNIYSLAALRAVSQAPRMRRVREWKQAQDYLAQPADKKDFDTSGNMTALVMFEQLRVAFGDDFYPELHRRSRAKHVRVDEKITNEDKKHWFMTHASQIANKNLSKFFATWGLKMEKRTLEEMGQLPDTDEDYSRLPVYQDLAGYRPKARGGQGGV